MVTGTNPLKFAPAPTPTFLHASQSAHDVNAGMVGGSAAMVGGAEGAGMLGVHVVPGAAGMPSTAGFAPSNEHAHGHATLASGLAQSRPLTGMLACGNQLQPLSASSTAHASQVSVLASAMAAVGGYVASASGTALPPSLPSPHAPRHASADGEGAATMGGIATHGMPSQRSGHDFLAAIAGQGVITSCANPTGYWQGQPPSTTDATDREAAASAPAPHAAESGADGGSGYGGSLEARTSRKRPCACGETVCVCSSGPTATAHRSLEREQQQQPTREHEQHVPPQPPAQQPLQPLQQHSDAGAPTGMSASASLSFALPPGDGRTQATQRLSAPPASGKDAADADMMDRAHGAFLIDLEPAQPSIHKEEGSSGGQAGGGQSSARLGSIGGTGALRTNLSSASLSDSMSGSLRDLQQLAAAFSAPASQPPRVAGLRSGCAGRHDGSSDASRLSPATGPAAFGAMGSSSCLPGGKQTSHSPPGPLAGERFAAAMGAVGGTDDLGDATEMQLDGILDMLDNWEQFERPQDGYG